MANDGPDSPVTCRTIAGPVVRQKERTQSPVTCGHFTGRGPKATSVNLGFDDHDPYRFYNAVAYAFSERNFARLRVNARKYYGPRSLDRCVLEALPGCLARLQDERCRAAGAGAAGLDDLTARSKAKRQRRFLGLGRRNPFDAVDTFETIHQSKVGCYGEVAAEPDTSFIPHDLTTSEFRAALLDSLVGAYVRERWDGLDVDAAFERFSQEYLTEDRQATRRRRNYCGGVGRRKRPAALSPRITDGAMEEDGSTATTRAPTLPRLYKGKLITVSNPGRVVNWKVRYWNANALDKVAASGRK